MHVVLKISLRDSYGEKINEIVRYGNLKSFKAFDHFTNGRKGR